MVSVAVSKARELGLDTVACASTGNLANSVAAHAAAAGLPAVVFIPVGLEAGKVIGTLVYGPTVVFRSRAPTTTSTASARSSPIAIPGGSST